MHRQACWPSSHYRHPHTRHTCMQKSIFVNITLKSKMRHFFHTRIFSSHTHTHTHTHTTYSIPEKTISRALETDHTGIGGPGMDSYPDTKIVRPVGESNS